MLTMSSGPSYAAATATPSQHNVQDLYSPPPTSFSLVAALLLLDNPLYTETNSSSVFLIPQSYLQNWITWAYHQPVRQEEMRRIQLALRMAADSYKLIAPKLNENSFQDPGPMDNSDLANPKQPLMLRDNVVVWNGEKIMSKTPKLLSCAVPERFYELLRSVHGVVCEDGKSIAFQAEPPSILIYHHDPMKPQNGHSNPMDFRRSVVIVTEEPKAQLKDANRTMSKLMNEESEQNGPITVPTVEVYPKRFTYGLLFDDSSTTRSGGFLLCSKATNAVDALHAIMKEICPTKSSQCVRLWTKHIAKRQDRKTLATVEGDGYELVHLEKLDGKLNRKDLKKEKSNMTVEEFINRYKGSRTSSTNGELDMLIETRPSISSRWAREALELANRIQVGDFVDAQDTAGKWYEAIVREVKDDLVTVHYAGWATKWNGTIRRRHEGDEIIEGSAKNVNAPEPLWTHTSRWREQIKVDELVEIRESSSQLSKPKWFKGYIRTVGTDDDNPRPIMGGAPLELMEWNDVADNGTTSPSPLVIMNRLQQVQVEVPSEKQSRPSVASRNGDSDDNKPPYIRWVNLYGEEICQAGTHMKIARNEKRPVTVHYEWDKSKAPVEVLKSHMHGAGFVRESLRGQPAAPGSVGLQNLGNSCYMNSIVQCFNHCDQITQYFLKETYAKDVNRNNPLGSGGAVALAYGSLLSDIWGGKYSVLAPRLLKNTVANFAPQFNNIYQHDSHEFCSFLMDGIHEDCNRVESKPYVEDLEGFGMADIKIAIESWRRHLLRHDSIIVDHCQGMHRSHVTCPICARESIKFDVFSSLSVPLPASKDGAPVPLDDCLEKFTEGEQLDENNAWYCKGCQKHVCALKMLALWSVPDVLIIHLKRFTYESRNGRVVRSKLEDKIVFPIDNLDMKQYVLGPIDPEAPPVYNLFGVSEHSGATANSGHYTATVRNSQDNKWYRYNDSNVGSSSGEASVTGGAYLLFYKRAKGTARWGGIEKAMKEQDALLAPPKPDKDGFTAVKTKKKGRKR